MVPFWAFLHLGGKSFNLSWVTERRQVNVRVSVTEGACSPLPVLNDLGIQSTTKITSQSGFPCSINYQRNVFTTILVLIMLCYNHLPFGFFTVRLLQFYTFWGQCQPLIFIQYLQVFLSWLHLRIIQEIAKYSNYFSLKSAFIKYLLWSSMCLGCLKLPWGSVEGAATDQQKPPQFLTTTIQLFVCMILPILSISYKQNHTIFVSFVTGLFQLA